MSSLRRLVIDALFAVEPISPPFISFFLERRLNKWQKQGFLDEYKVKTKRLGKFHYKIEVDLDLTKKQLDTVFSITQKKLVRR